MDTITQGLLGATIGAAGWQQRLGRRAVVVGGLCAMAPDLDVVSAIAGPWQSLLYHRGASHSLLVLPWVAIALGWLAWRWAARRGSPWQWVHLCAWALLTHPLLDVCTAYGTQLLAPLSRQRFAIDAVAIIDFFYSIPLLVATVLALRRNSSPRLARGLAIAALAATTVYLSVGWVQSRRAEARAESQLRSSGFEPVEIRALPTLLNNQLFRVVARDDAGSLRIGHISMLAPRPIRFLQLEPTHEDPLVQRALESEHGQMFTWFAMDMVHARRGETSAQGATVRITDQRYGLISRPTNSIFVAVAYFDAQRRLRKVERVRSGERDVGRELAAMWDLLWGHSARRAKRSLLLRGAFAANRGAW